MTLMGEELTEPERRLWQAASTGELVDLQPAQPSLDPVQGAAWNQDCTVRAEVLVELLTGANTPPQAPRARAVKLRGARITGALDLASAILVCPLELRSCFFEKPVNLQQVQAPEVRLPGCHLPSLAADQLETRGSVVLTEGFTATGEVSLAGAHIGGQLYCDDARLDNPGGWALYADGLTVSLSVLCRRLTAEGTVRLPGARIGMTVEFDSATLVNLDGEALRADELRVDGSMFCRRGFTAQGEVRLPGARIGGELSFEGATLVRPGGWALTGDGLAVGGSMFCGTGLMPSKEPFTAEGEVALPNAHIAGQLSLIGAKLNNPAGRALTADGLAVDRSMLCTQCTVHGEVRLIGARIGGALNLSDSRLVKPDKQGRWALSADRLKVEGSMHCADKFDAQGQVSLAGAHIGGQLILDGANLDSPDGWALYAAGLTVRADVTCREKFRAQGGVSLADARIGGTLNLSGATLTSYKQTALLADGLSVDADMRCQAGFTANGEVGLVGARIGGQLSFTDAVLDNPGSQALFADGLTVERNMHCGGEFVAKGEVRLPRARISEQLRFEDALIVEGAIRDDGEQQALQLQGLSVPVLVLKLRRPPAGMVDLVAAHVGVFVDEQESWPPAKRLRLRGFTYDALHNTEIGVKARLSWLARDKDGYSPQLYEQLAAVYRRAGHEENARRVAIEKQRRRRSTLNPLGKAWSWLLDLTVGFGYRTWQAAVWLLGLLLVGTWVFDRAYPVSMVPAKQPVPPFHAVVYTLDVLVPIVDLGQQSSWLPKGAALDWSWVLIGAGWVLTTAVVAGLAGILKRD